MCSMCTYVSSIPLGAWVISKKSIAEVVSNVCPSNTLWSLQTLWLQRMLSKLQLLMQISERAIRGKHTCQKVGEGVEGGATYR